MYRGIAPRVLLAQVRNTAAWALDGPADTPATSWRAALRHGESVTQDPRDPRDESARHDHLRLLLAAHFATVATFVPTDVDSHIRHHAWEQLATAAKLRAAVALLDALDHWDAREVSARVVEVPGVPGGGALSGHDGEWLAVRAGALGRALALEADDVVEALAARIEAELDREARALAAVRDAKGRESDALRVAATLAHNAGDLSRVVEEWPARGPAARALHQRFARVGHPDAPRRDEVAALFRLAGHVNKAVTAAENHRFLCLRDARGLRSSRDVLLPLGPFFDAWGERLGRHPGMADAKPAVLAALLTGHTQDPAQQGYLRAVAGLHRASPGGVERLAPDVPARLRRLLVGGPVREALRLDAERFEARMANRYRAAAGSFGG